MYHRCLCLWSGFGSARLSVCVSDRSGLPWVWVQLMLGLQREKLAPTVVSGLGAFVPSWPCAVVRLYHESSFSSQSRDFLCFLHHRRRVLDRGSLRSVVHGTKGELAGIYPAAWAACSPQQSAGLAGLAGWYTCVLLFAGVDLLSTPQKVCVVKAGRHGSHKRGYYGGRKREEEPEEPEGPGDRISTVPLAYSLGPCMQVLASLALADCVGCIHMCTHLS